MRFLIGEELPGQAQHVGLGAIEREQARAARLVGAELRPHADGLGRGEGGVEELASPARQLRLDALGALHVRPDGPARVLLQIPAQLLQHFVVQRQAQGIGAGVNAELAAIETHLVFLALGGDGQLQFQRFGHERLLGVCRTGWQPVLQIIRVYTDYIAAAHQRMNSLAAMQSRLKPTLQELA